MSLAGGCQCGAVRFRLEGAPGGASICHCRMCQKATGGFFGPYVSVPRIEDLVWTRGERKRFQSSNKVHRGFCGDCGTPLTFEFGDRHVGIAIGALDRPADVTLSEQLASPAQVFDLAELARLPVHPTNEPRAAAHLASIVSHQHPDHDTEGWTPGT